MRWKHVLQDIAIFSPSVRFVETKTQMSKKGAQHSSVSMQIHVEKRPNGAM